MRLESGDRSLEEEKGQKGRKGHKWLQVASWWLGGFRMTGFTFGFLSR